VLRLATDPDTPPVSLNLGQLPAPAPAAGSPRQLNTDHWQLTLSQPARAFCLPGRSRSVHRLGKTCVLGSLTSHPTSPPNHQAYTRGKAR